MKENRINDKPSKSDSPLNQTINPSGQSLLPDVEIPRRSYPCSSTAWAISARPPTSQICRDIHPAKNPFPRRGEFSALIPPVPLQPTRATSARPPTSQTCRDTSSGEATTRRHLSEDGRAHHRLSGCLRRIAADMAW